MGSYSGNDNRKGSATTRATSEGNNKWECVDREEEEDRYDANMTNLSNVGQNR